MATAHYQVSVMPASPEVPLECAMWLCGLVLVFLVPFTLVANELSPLCTRVVHVDTCDGTLWLAWEVDVKPGDSVIIYQSQGALQDAEGKPDTSGGAGRWSVHEVLSRNGSSVQLSSIPVAYPLEGSVQLCPVIYGTHVTIIEPHTVRPWNDGANGVLMISADTLTISAAIDAVGSGFPGGRASMNSWDTSRTDAMADWTSGIGGGRGLGIAVMGHDKAAGRLSSCNGGGGGNARNAGGGGGAGAGRGGRGGHQTSEYGSEPVGGMGGHALIPNSAAQVWLGGGGGGGHQNDFLGADGGAGGGLVILRARYLRWMRGATIQAGGESAATAIGDGAGGGGGGGTVVLDVDTVWRELAPDSSVPVISVTGGNGGCVLSDLRCYGPGGGGGGGSVVFGRAYDVGNFVVDVHGGVNGSSLGGGCTIDSSYGAEAGVAGNVHIRHVPPYLVGDPCGIPDIEVRIADTSGNPGDHVNIRLIVEARTTRPEPLTIRMRIRTRASVLWPHGPYWWSGRRYTTRYVDVTLPAGAPRVDEVMLPYQCLLGDSAQVAIMIDSLVVSVPAVHAVVSRHGVFSIANLCRAGERVRLFDPFGQVQQAEMFTDLQGRIWRRSDLRFEASGLHQRLWPIRPHPGQP